MSSNAPSASLDEMRALLARLPGPDLEAGTLALNREAQLTKPAGALGRLEEIAHWMSIWQGKHPPSVNHPRTAVFVGNHGVAARGVSAYPAEVTKQMVQNFLHGGAAVNQLCRSVDADLRVYELALEEPTADFTRGPAMTEEECAMAIAYGMTEEECAMAIAYGMTAVETGVDLLAVGEMGIANTTSAAALCCAIFGDEAEQWVGPGTGVSREGLQRKLTAVAEGVVRHRAETDEPFDLLRRLGGRELAAIVGAVMAARQGRVPVILDGYAATAAAAVLFAADPHALDHCIVAHRSAEPGHRRLLAKLSKPALLDLGMRLGEASGATLAIAVIKAAVACHTGMATFADAGVSGKSG